MAKKVWYYKQKEWAKAYDELMAYCEGKLENAPSWNPDVTDVESDEYDGYSELFADDKDGAITEFWTNVSDEIYCYIHDC